MTLDAGQIRIASTGSISLAAAGSTLPDDATTALDAAFVGLGYTTTEGVTFNPGRGDPTGIEAWQSLSPVRYMPTADSPAVDFILMQWNADTVVLGFGGGAVTEPEAGVFKYTPPAAGSMMRRALVVEWEDTPGEDTYHYRIVVPQGIPGSTSGSQFTRTQEARLPVTFRPEIASGQTVPWFLITDDPSFDEGGS